eukprot:TRINITY_DN7059_c0_g1_i2.p1 TRINITY_DN7059_c0_g1~~TRINITY_DN7059_c0_g1_i2.p1  ORF type:complete len:955 (+),score=170.51 TRINITY_DN7059_c0_g1_i2:385-3249(+)
MLITREPPLAHEQSGVHIGIKPFFTRPNRMPDSVHATNTNHKRFLSPENHVVGRFQTLKSFSHRNLCQYIEVVNSSCESRLFVISEHYPESLRTKLNKAVQSGNKGLSEKEVRDYSFQIMAGLSYLNGHGLIHRNLSLDNILVDAHGVVKLADYGLFHITGYGSFTNFPIGDPNYLSPEAIAAAGTTTSWSEELKKAEFNLSLKKSTSEFVDSDVRRIQMESVEAELRVTPKTDVWSLGIILILLLTGEFPWIVEEDEEGMDPYQVLLSVLKFAGHHFSMEEELAKHPRRTSSDHDHDHRKEEPVFLKGINRGSWEEMEQRLRINMKQVFALPGLQVVSSSLKEIIRLCLDPNPHTRITIDELMRAPYYKEEYKAYRESMQWVLKPYLKSHFLLQQKEKEDSRENVMNGEIQTPKPKYEDCLSLSEFFHFWLHAVGNLEQKLPEKMRIPPPVLLIPDIVRVNGGSKDIDLHNLRVSGRYHDTIACISLDSLRSDFSKNVLQKAPRRLRKSSRATKPTESNRTDSPSNRNRSFSARENDFLYQQERILLFKKLLKGYPETRARITKAARDDIPHVLRAEIWACILGVETQQTMDDIWATIDFATPHVSDYQISLDVPRCHQYHHLLSSPEGHAKLNLALRAWARYNPDLNYWQGVDSLMAPFLILNFNNLPKALFCLQQVVETYLKPFFKKEKSVYLQEHLVMYQQLLAYKDPELAMHLHVQNFNPDLYAIPWFLTLFAHIFSLDNIVRIWDTILVSPPSLPFFIAIAIMQQLRSTLLSMEFNDCILFFSGSGMPPIKIEKCLANALKTLQNTPPSLTTHDPTEENELSALNNRPPLDELRLELFPRLSVSDMINDKSNIVIFDVRKEEEWRAMRFPGSVWVADSNDISPYEKFRGKPIVVMGKGGSDGVEFANNLVLKGKFPYVSLLQGGIESVKTFAKGVLEVLTVKTEKGRS